jgi:endoglucanase
MARLVRIVLATALLTLVSASSAAALSVEGNTLVDDNGNPTRLLGVNRDGTEYMCDDGYLFDSPTPSEPDSQEMVDAIASWGANAVRIPLNEACWLGINHAPKKASGETYRSAIETYVSRVEDAGMYPILELHVVLPGKLSVANDPGLRGMVDEKHGVKFWRQVAQRFGGNTGTVFDLYNEPYVGWKCLRDGCNVKRDDYIKKLPTYKSAGTQQLVDVIRKTGAQNVILVGGTSYSNDLSRWLEFVPNDPLGRIAASFHNYEGPEEGQCHLECWDATIAPVAEQYPVVTGEIGDFSADNSVCNHDYIDQYMPWADDHGVSYLGWTWNSVSGGYHCGNGPSLIEEYDGTPTGYGIGLRDHLLSLLPNP